MTTPDFAPSYQRQRRAHRERSTHFVYECYDALGQPLYVGCTINLGARLSQHARRDWWPYVHSIKTTAHDNRHKGLTAELDLIHRLAPPYNIQGLSHEQLMDRA